MAKKQKRRASYLTVSQTLILNNACRPLAGLGYGTFHVGSSLTRSDYQDVDLRCLLPDDQYDRMFGGPEEQALLPFLHSAISEWLKARTDLPIDFQFQRATQANEAYPQESCRRNGVGH